MVREDLILYKTRTLLDEFLAPMQAQVDRPRKRFLLQAVRGILFSGTLVMMERCRRIRDDCSDRLYQDKRLLNHLTSPRAKKMKYLGLVRDESTGTLVPGYWCVEVYAHLPHKRILPLALDVYSIAHPPSRNG